MKMVNKQDDDMSYFAISEKGRRFLEVYQELLGFCGIESALKQSLEL
jgi:predicted transcriptional regulator